MTKNLRYQPYEQDKYTGCYQVQAYVASREF